MSDEAPVRLSIESYLECVPVRQDRVNWMLADLSVPGTAAVGDLHGEMVLVLDTSGSMYSPQRGANGERSREAPIDQVIEATRSVIEALHPADRLGIVAFDDRGRLVCPLTAGEARKRLHDSLDGLKEDGGGITEMKSGLATAIREIRQNARDPRAVRLVVLTDGQATDDQDTLEYVRTLERQSIAAMGFGDFDFEFMNKVCAPSKGLCTVLDPGNVDQLRQDFLSELHVAQNTVATNVRLQIEPLSCVRLRKAYVVHPHPTLLGDVELDAHGCFTVDLPILDRTEGIQIVYDLVHTPRDPGLCQTARLTALYDVPSLGQKDQRVEAVFEVEYTTDERELRNVNQNVKLARDRGYDEELRSKYEAAKASGYDDEADQILDTMKKSSDSVVADTAATIRKGDTPTSSQDLQLATRRKSSPTEVGN